MDDNAELERWRNRVGTTPTVGTTYRFTFLQRETRIRRQT